MATLNDLIARIQAGDDAAFTELYDEIVPRLKKFFTNPKGRFRLSPQEADDAVQETMMVVSKKIPTFNLQGKADPSTWIHSIGIYKGMDQLRKRGDLVPLDDLDEISASSAEHPEGERPHPSTGLAMRAFRSISKSKRDILRHTAHGLNDKQIAEKLGKSLGAVRTQLHRARKDYETEYHKLKKTP